DREGDRELGGRDHRRRGDRDAGADGGARPRLEVRARHAHREARPRRSRAWRHAGDGGDGQGHGRDGRGAVGEGRGEREAGPATKLRRAEVGREHEEDPAVGDGRATVKPPRRTTDWPSGFETVTSRGPRAAVFVIARATQSCVLFPSAALVRSTPAPTAALAPAWKFVPVTLTVRLAPGAPELGDTLAIVGTVKVTVAMAEEPSAKVAVSVKLAPLLNCVGLKSEANTKKTPPSATAKVTVPVPVLSSAASRLAVAPRAQLAVAGSVSQTPPPPPF